jgi:hypothetical protein
MLRLNKLWNNKFYYKLRLVGISTESYYNARIYEYQICKSKNDGLIFQITLSITDMFTAYLSIKGMEYLSIPAAARSKALIYGRSLAGITGSNTAGGLDVCLF